MFEANLKTLLHAYLPHAHDGIGDKDEEDYKRLDESSDGAFSFFKPGQDLTETWNLILTSLFIL